MDGNCVNWAYIDSKYPTKFNKDEMTQADFRKERTIELYDYLPQTSLEERATYLDIRDAVIDLNYKFFGYIASHKFVNNNYISYEDKFQSALSHFCEMWEKYRFWGGKYRTDVAFGVFFKPRITECMERELDEVKYSLRRTLCIEVGNQLNKHWAKVTYEDLGKVKLSPEKLTALQAIFGSMYVADLDTHAMFIESKDSRIDSSDLYSDDYNSLEELLMHEMIEKERCLEDEDLDYLSNLLTVPRERLESLLPAAKERLHSALTERIDFIDTFK